MFPTGHGSNLRSFWSENHACAPPCRNWLKKGAAVGGFTVQAAKRRAIRIKAKRGQSICHDAAIQGYHIRKTEGVCFLTGPYGSLRQQSCTRQGS